MNNLINTKGLDISKAKSLAEFVAAATEVESQLKEAWGLIEQQMLERDINQVKGEGFTLSIAERKNWKASGTLPPRFYKQVLDTSKLNFMFKAGEKVPAGAMFTTSKYLTKRVK